MSGNKKGVMGLLGKIDMYKKFKDDSAEMMFMQSTNIGVTMSAVSVVAMALLFLLEFSTYMTPTYKTDIVVDEQVDAKMKVFFDFTIFDLPCRHAVVDVEDSLGMAKHNVSKHIIKVRLDAKGRNLGEHKDVDITATGADQGSWLDNVEHKDRGVSTEVNSGNWEAAVQRHRVAAVDFYAPWCIWCQRLKPVWDRTAKFVASPEVHEASLEGLHEMDIALFDLDCTTNPEVCQKHHIRAYPTILIFRDGDLMHPVEAYEGERAPKAIAEHLHRIYIGGHYNEAEEKKKQNHQEDKMNGDAAHDSVAGPEGCRLFGYLVVPKVPGNFHVNLVQPGHETDPKLINASHKVNHFSFEPPTTRFEGATKVHKILEDKGDDKWDDKLDTWIAKHVTHHGRFDNTDFISKHAAQTFTHYQKVVPVLMRHQRYGDIHSYKYTVHSNEHVEKDNRVPSVMFQYDLSAMAVLTTRSDVPFFKFITSVCAIVGGAFTVLGLLDSFVFNTAEMLSKKND